jgi:glycerate kinase
VKIIIAPGSFKGNLTAKEVTFSIAPGVRAALPHAYIDTIPVADGGEGTLETLISSAKGKYIITEAVDPFNRPIKGRYGVLGERGTSLMYSRQKGATPEIADQLEKDMQLCIDIAEKSIGRHVRDIPTAGAVGGLGAVLMLFLGRTSTGYRYCYKCMYFLRTN